MPHISTPTCTLPCRQTGFSLLEALVTLLIVSLGLLGIAGIIATSLRVNQGAHFRSIASLQAADIIDRMRANRTQAPDYALLECPPVNIPGVPTADLIDWCANLASALPGGDGTVNLAAGRVTVTVSWDDARAQAVSGQAADTVGGISMETQL